MTRVDNWPTMLAAVIRDAESAPFAWGVHDCVTFAADCARAMTGDDPLRDLPTWADARQALRVIEGEGGMAEALSARFGDAIAPAFAQRGDIGLIAGDQREGLTGAALAVCMGDVWLAPGDSGLVRVLGHRIAEAWRVGR